MASAEHENKAAYLLLQVCAHGLAQPDGGRALALSKWGWVDAGDHDCKQRKCICF